MSPWWIPVALAIFGIGLTKSGFGAGLGLLITPLVVVSLEHLPTYGSAAALGLILPLLLVGDVIAVWQYRRLFRADLVRRLLPGTALGVALGGAVLWSFHSHAAIVGALIRIEIGVESILLVGLTWWRQWRGVQHVLLPEPLRGRLAGAFAGVSSTLAHAAGPILAMYLLPLNLDRRLFVGTNAVYFFALNLMKLPAYIAAGQFETIPPLRSLQFAPLVLAGALTGVWLVRRMNDRLFVRIVYVTTFVLGWYILADGIAQLARL